MNKIVLTAVVFFLFVFNTNAQEKYLLKNRYPEGTYEMKTETEMNMLVKMGEQIVPNQQSQTQYQHIVAGPIKPDGSQEVITEIYRIATKQNVNGRNIEFDSAAENAKNSPLRMLGVMVGLKVTMTFDQDGKIAKVEGIDEFLEKVSASFPKPVFDMMKKQLSDKAMTKTFDALRDAMPSQPVAIGEKWNSESQSEIPIIGKIKTELQNTLKAIQQTEGKELAEIESQSQIKSDKSQEINMGAAQMTFKNADINSESTIQMEIKTGLVVSNVTKMKINMEAEITANNQTMKQNMSGEGKTAITVTRSKKSEE
ncbi:MAG: DUF6263 family protein [Planctomycetaceae bacterium]|jgi:hypothetical protein|nr:DUF6263 family protein [Planctomycetaceae bacterium]